METFLELKIWAFTVFIIAIFFAVSFIRYKISESRKYFKYYIQDENFGSLGIVITIIASVILAVRLLVLIGFWWFK